MALKVGLDNSQLRFGVRARDSHHALGYQHGIWDVLAYTAVPRVGLSGMLQLNFAILTRPSTRTLSRKAGREPRVGLSFRWC